MGFIPEELIFDIGVNTGSSVKDMDTLIKRFAELKEREAEIRANLNKFKKSLREVAKDPSLKDTTEQYSDLGSKVVLAEADLRNLRAEQKKLNKEFDLFSSPEKSIDKLRKQTRFLREELENTTVGVDKSEKEFNELRRTVTRNQEAIIKWDQSLKDGRTNVGRYRESLGRLSVGFTNIAGALAGAFAISGFTDFVREATEAYDVQAQNEQKLLVALKGREDVQQRLLAQASQFQETTSGLVTDEQIIEQQAFLATLGATEEQINDIIAASIDLSAGANIGLDSSVRNLAKTFSGLSGELGEQIPALRDLTAEQLKAGAAVELVAEQFRGQAEAAGNAGIGALRGYQMAIGDVQEEIGKELLPVQEGLTRAQLRFFELLRDGLRIISPWIARIRELPQFIRENRTTLIALTVALAAFNAGAIAAAANALRQAAAQKALTIATRAQAIAQTLLNRAMSANPVGLIVAGIGLLIAAFDQAIKRSANFRAFISGIRESGIELFNVLREAFAQFIEAFNAFREGDIGAGFKALGQSLVKANPIGIAVTQGKRLGEAYKRGFEESKLQDAIKAEATAVAGEKNEFQKAGEALGSGIEEGIQEGLGGGGGVARDSLEGLKKELGDLEKSLQKISETDTEAIRTKLEAIGNTKDKIERLEQAIAGLNLELQKQNNQELLEIAEPIQGLNLTDGVQLDSATAEIEREEFVQGELQRIRSEAFEAEVEERHRRNDEIQQIEQDKFSLLEETANAAANLAGDFIGSALADTEEFGRNLLVLALEQLEKLALLRIAEAQLKEIGSKGFIGVGTGLVLAAIIRGIVAAVRRVILAEHGIRIEGKDDLPRREHIIQGRSHAAGGKYIGGGIEAEGGEAFMFDEFGGRNVINKRSTRRFRPVLNAIMGKRFPGKLALLDAINQAGGGRPLIGARSFSAPRPARFVPPRALYQMQSGGRIESTATAALDNSDVVAELRAIRADLQTLEVGVDALNKAERKQQLTNRLNQA